MQPDYTSIRQQTLDALNAGKPQDAFRLLRPILAYPGQLFDDTQFAEAFGLFARIAVAIAGEEFAATVQSAAQAIDDPNALYYLGYELIEQELPEIAATVLFRANTLLPGHEALVTELVASLERSGHHAAACLVLHQSPELLDTRFIFQYLLAFNAVMIGDLEEPRRMLPRLQQATSDDERFMTARIARMLSRAEALQGTSPLDENDLRGWHFVLTGGMLLHLSPYGFEEGMRGRYAYVQDEVTIWREGIQRLAEVLNTWQVRPPRVFALPDQESMILAHAAGELLMLPVEPWTEMGSHAPGLVVAYDLGSIEPAVLQTLHEHRPGQVLWSHASCWTQEQPFAADLTTYLYQHNVSPFGERLRIDPKTNTMVKISPVVGSTAELVQQVVTTAASTDALADLPTLVTLASAVSALPPDYAAGALKQTGRRERQWVGSPVQSSRFL